MAATLFRKVDYPLSKLIEDIDIGEIGLPDIQRPFVWGTAKVRDLFDSMYKGFPVGYFLFWANSVGDAGRAVGTNQKQKVPRLLIVDGQQRLTSLYAILRGQTVLDKNYQERPLKIGFRPLDQSFEVTNVAVERDPEFIPDISLLWAGEESRNRFVRGFIRRLRDHREVSDDHEDALTEKIDRLYDLQNYPFTALELSETVDEEQVADVFVRINSKGTTLNQADFILTLMSVYWEEGRRALERFCFESRRQPDNGKPSSYNRFVEPDPDQLLRVAVGLGFRRARLKFVYNILRGKDLETGEVSPERRDRQFEVLKEAQEYALDLNHWHDFLKTLLRAGFRSGSMITSKTTIFYTYVMYLIGRRDFGVDHHRLRDLIAAWFFMCSLSRRYTSSPESTMEADLALLRGAKKADDFVGTLDRIIRDHLTEDFWRITLPNTELDSSSTYSPSLFAYYAALNVLGARALFSKVQTADLLDPHMKGTRAPVERHHLFPKAYLKRETDSDDRTINQIANYAYVEWPDNADISDSPPSEYFPGMADRFTEDELEDMMRWHALPDGWHEMEYSEFLEERRRRMAQVTKEGFERLFVPITASV